MKTATLQALSKKGIPLVVTGDGQERNSFSYRTNARVRWNFFLSSNLFFPWVPYAPFPFAYGSQLYLTSFCKKNNENFVFNILILHEINLHSNVSKWIFVLVWFSRIQCWVLFLCSHLCRDKESDRLHRHYQGDGVVFCSNGYVILISTQALSPVSKGWRRVVEPNTCQRTVRIYSVFSLPVKDVTIEM